MTRRTTFRTIVLASLLILLTVQGCNLPSRTANQSAGYLVKAAEGGTFEWPDVGTLEIPAGALSQDTQVNASPSGEEVPFPPESSFTLIGDEVEIDLGGVPLTGHLTMTYTLPPDTPVGDSTLFIIARTYAPDGTPMALGAIRDGLELRFPVIGEGFYQLFTIEKPDYAALSESLAEIREPLTVPTYPQVASDWCSPTALTMMAQYHEGAWPAGGTGSKWGETSSWYLTGLAHQPANSGNFFHNLLRAAGYSAPIDVRQSFSTADMIVIIWNWESAIWQDNTASHNAGDVDMEFAEELYQAFRAYVESNFWGIYGIRRPVAWGSGMIEHSRVLTGSDGTKLYYNETANGQQNVAMTWESHHNAVMASLTTDPEIIDTVVMLSEPRPEEARQGVIWLRPETSTRGGSLVLRRIDGTEREDICYWYWDGSGTRTSGYYFDNHEVSPDPCASQPASAEFDHSFGIQDANYELYYEYDVLNISDEYHSYLAAVEVERASGGAPILIDHVETALLAPGTRAMSYSGYNLAGAIPLDINLGAGRHTLKFTLWLDGVLQDTKYVFFTVEPFTAPLPAMPTEPPMLPLVSTTPDIPQITFPTATLTPLPPTATATPYIPPTDTPQLIVPLTRMPLVPSCSMSSPVLSSPADGAWVGSLQPTLEWSYSSLVCWPDSYRIQIATDQRMSNIVQTGQTEAKTFIPAPLTGCTTYYWRVAGMNGSDSGPWSPVWSFTPGDARRCGP
ncbi:MAG: hypothetical protein JXJ17_15285 [Anaerolineae bacterium]|nr:hypothetical protein [Anaerolineae bacterium]